MATDAYIDTDYVDDRWGSALRTALFADTGKDITGVIQDATAEVKASLKNSGYTRPATTDPADVDAFIKMAVFGVFWEMVCAVPNATIALPDSWETNPYKAAIEDIRTGRAMLELEADTDSGVGGTIFTSSADTASPQQMSRDNLEGY